MELIQFLELAKNTTKKYNLYTHNPMTENFEHKEYYLYQNSEESFKGAVGGNCWGEQAEEWDSYLDEKTCEYDDNTFKKAIKVFLNALKEKHVFVDVIPEEVMSEFKYGYFDDDSAYYGNYSRYGIRYIDLKKLYENIMEKNNSIKMKI